jgi:hypothetical protein
MRGLGAAAAKTYRGVSDGLLSVTTGSVALRRAIDRETRQQAVSEPDEEQNDPEQRRGRGDEEETGDDHDSLARDDESTREQVRHRHTPEQLVERIEDGETERSEPDEHQPERHVRILVLSSGRYVSSHDR